MPKRKRKHHTRDALLSYSAPWATTLAYIKKWADMQPAVRDIQSGIRSLSAAVLLRAVQDVLEVDHVKIHIRTGEVARLRREALAWFFADGMSHPFSFLRICRTLNLSANLIRSKIESITLRDVYIDGSPKKGLIIKKNRSWIDAGDWTPRLDQKPNGHAIKNDID